MDWKSHRQLILSNKCYQGEAISSSSESRRGINLRPSFGGERLRLGGGSPAFAGIDVMAYLSFRAFSGWSMTNHENVCLLQLPVTLEPELCLQW